MSKKISQNLAYSWWVHNVATVEDGTDNILFGGVKSDGSPRVFRREPGEDYTTIDNYTLYTAPEADDHNAPSLISKAGKPLLAFWQRHGMSTTLNYWSAPEGTFTFGAKKTITFPLNVTYCQSLVWDDNIYIFLRAGSEQWYYVRSTDWGMSWSTPVVFFSGVAETGQMYCRFKQHDNIAQFAIYGHPSTSPWRDIVYGEINLDNGDIMSNEEVVANLDGTSLPLTPSMLEVVCTPSAAPGEKVRLLDVTRTSIGTPTILFARWNDANPIPVYYITQRGFYEPEIWDEKRLMSAGGVFDDGSNRKYVYGAAFGTDTLYVALKDTCGTYKIKQFAIDAWGGLYDERLIQSNSTYPLARPYVVGDNVIWQELREYTDYRNYLIHLWIKD